MTAPRYSTDILETAITDLGGSVVRHQRDRVDLLADLYNLISDAPLSSATTDEEGLLRAFYTLIVGSAPAHTLSPDKLMAAVAGVSAASVEGPELWQAFADAVVSFTPDEGGGGGGEQVTFEGDPVEQSADPVIFTGEG